MKLYYKFLTAIALILLAQLSFAGDPKWEVDFDKSVNWTKLTDAGIYLIGSNEGLFGINPEDGSILWSIDRLKKVDEENMEIVPFTPFAAIKTKGIFPQEIVVNTLNGKLLFDSKEAGYMGVYARSVIPEHSGIIVMGASKEGMVYTMVNFETGEIMWKKVAQDKGMFKQAFSFDANSLISYTDRAVYKIDAKSGDDIWKIEDKMISAVNIGRDGKAIYVSSKSGFMSYDSGKGKANWKDSPKLPGDVTAIYPLSKGMIVSMGEDIQKIDPATGKTMWKKEPKIKGDIFYLDVDEKVGLITASATDKKSVITIFDAKSGDAKWKKPVEIEGAVLEISVVGKGLLLSTNLEINIYDIESGEPQEKKGILSSKNGDIITTAKDKTRYLYSDETLYTLDTDNGKMKEFYPGLEFEEKEVPGSLSIQDNGILVKASQNMWLIDFDGKKIFEAYHEAPGISGAGKIALGALAVASTAMAAGAAAQAGYNRGALGSYHSATRQAQSYQEGFTDIANASFKAMGQRFKASQEAKNYVYILTNLKYDDEKGPGLVKVSKIDGKVVGEVILKDKEPEYVVDEASKLVYHLKNKRTIACYQL